MSQSHLNPVYVSNIHRFICMKHDALGLGKMFKHGSHGISSKQPRITYETEKTRPGAYHGDVWSERKISFSRGVYIIRSGDSRGRTYVETTRQSFVSTAEHVRRGHPVPYTHLRFHHFNAPRRFSSRHHLHCYRLHDDDGSTPPTPCRPDPDGPKIILFYGTVISNQITLFSFYTLLDTVSFRVLPMCLHLVARAWADETFWGAAGEW